MHLCLTRICLRVHVNTRLCGYWTWYSHLIPPPLSYSPVWQRAFAQLGWNMYHEANDRQTHGTEQWMYGQMDKCLSEMQKQMAAFIPRRWESRVMVQLGTWRMPLTGCLPFGQQWMGWIEEEQRPSLADKIITWKLLTWENPSSNTSNM